MRDFIEKTFFRPLQNFFDQLVLILPRLFGMLMVTPNPDPDCNPNGRCGRQNIKDRFSPAFKPISEPLSGP